MTAKNAMSEATQRVVFSQLPLTLRSSLPWPRCGLRTLELPSVAKVRYALKAASDVVSDKDDMRFPSLFRRLFSDEESDGTEVT